VEIRGMRESDVEAIARLHIRSWQVAYRGLLPDALLDGLDATYERRVAQGRAAPKADVFVAEQDTVALGFARISASRDPDASPETGELMAIYLAPEAWGKGIGRELLGRAVDELRARGYRRATLWVLDTNARARRFYEAAGWRADGSVKEEPHLGATLREVRYAREL
jgi:GNAT superfamily N-acetyltransferase